MATFTVSGNVVSGAGLGVSGADIDVQVYLATMEPSGNPLILNQAATTDDAGDFQVDFDPIFGSNIYGVWGAAFDANTQKAGAQCATGPGIHWVTDTIFDMGVIALKAAG